MSANMAGPARILSARMFTREAAASTRTQTVLFADSAANANARDASLCIRKGVMWMMIQQRAFAALAWAASGRIASTPIQMEGSLALEKVESATFVV